MYEKKGGCMKKNPHVFLVVFQEDFIFIFYLWKAEPRHDKIYNYISTKQNPVMMLMFLLHCY